MRAMKDSGNKWIGEIPETWGIERIKTIFSERTELSEDGSETLLSVSEYYGVANRAEKIDDGEYVSRADSLIGYKKCFKGDLVSNIMLAWKGSMGITELDGIVSPAYCVYKPSKSIYPRYYHYLFRTSLYTSIFRLYSKGIIDSRLRLYSPYFFDIKAIIPSYAEQQRIAEFLDKKCAEVDEMIGLQEQIIEELKAYKQSVITEAVTKGLNPDAPMKDSGIEWIGEIPEHWETIRVKYIADVQGRVGFKGYTKEDLVDAGEGAYTIGGKHITTNVLNLDDAEYISWEKYYESPEIMVNKGDIVFAQRGTLGRAAYIDREIGAATINPSLVLIKNIITNAKYLHWYLISSSMLTEIDLLNTSTAVPMISQFQINNIYVPHSPINEQEAIAEYLNTKCTEIDNLISIKLSKIDSLKEYKKSIIYEYVTGKREVE